MRSSKTIGFGLIGASVSWAVIGCSDQPAQQVQLKEQQFAEEIDDPADLEPIEHPLANRGAADPSLAAMRAQGVVPLHDVKNMPSGARVAIFDGASSDADGNVRQFGGIEELARRPAPSRRKAGIMSRVAPSKIGQPLQSTVDAGTAETVDVIVAVDHNEKGLTRFLDREIALGRVATRSDRDRASAQYLAAKRARVRAALAPIIQKVQALGGVVLYEAQNLYALNVRLPLGAVDALAAFPRVARLDMVQELTPAATDQDAIRKGTQTDQLTNFGYDGNNGSSLDLEIAILEDGAVNEEHLSFKDSGTSGDRFLSRVQCNSNGQCVTHTNFSNSAERDHATKIASILMGDLDDNQDPNYTGSTEQKQRSSFAPESHLHIYSTPSDQWLISFDHINGISSRRPKWVNFSQGWDDDCKGTSTIAKKANELFEDGILVVAAAGNNGSSGSSCNINTPADAIGVFSINAYGVDADGENDVRYGDICNSGSSLGADLSGWTQRNLVSASAYGPRGSYLARYDDDDGYASVGCWTSYATPTAISSMVAFSDFYNQEVSSLLLSDPGYMHAVMLLMGDRQARTGGQARSSFRPEVGRRTHQDAQAER